MGKNLQLIADKIYIIPVVAFTRFATATWNGSIRANKNDDQENIESESPFHL